MALRASQSHPRRYGNSVTQDSSSLQVPSAYLEQFPIPIHITELASPDHAQTVLEERCSSELYGADVAILMYGSSSQLSCAGFPKDNASTIFVKNLDNPPAAELLNPGPIHSALINRGTFLSISPRQALSALHTLQKNPGSPEAVQVYQTQMSASCISSLTDTLNKIFASLQNNPSIPMAVVLRIRTALSHVDAALRACRASVQHAREEMDTLSARLSDLSSRVEEEQARVHVDVFGVPEHSAATESTDVVSDSDVVGRALKRAETEMKIVLDQLTWWRMIWRVDEISVIVGGAVERAWCKELEHQVWFYSSKALHGC